MMKLALRLVAVLGAVATLVLLSPPMTARAARELPFEPGEKLVYVLKWSGISIGTATIEAPGPELLDGRQVQHFIMTATSNEFADKFFIVRDRSDSYTDMDITHTVHYLQKQREGSYKRDITVTFDLDRMQAQYSNEGKPRDPIAIRPGTLDPLSIFYYFRLLDVEDRTQAERPVTDGKKCVTGKARIIRRETIQLEDIVYDTYLVQPDLSEIGGVFKKSRNASMDIWVTADSRRIPVLIRSKVIIGSFTAELTSYTPGTARAAR